MHAVKAKSHINLLRLNAHARQAQQTYKSDKSRHSQGIISKKVFMIRVGCLNDGLRALRNVSWLDLAGDLSRSTLH